LSRWQHGLNGNLQSKRESYRAQPLFVSTISYYAQKVFGDLKSRKLL
jgi:hypothetical protein